MHANLIYKRNDGEIFGNIDHLDAAGPRASLPDALGNPPTPAENIFFAGTREDGWHFFGVRAEDGTYRVMAGCRNFTLYEARDHWNSHGDMAVRNRSLELVDAIQKWADSGLTAPEYVRRTAQGSPTPVPEPTPEHVRQTARRFASEQDANQFADDVQEFLGERLWAMFMNWRAYSKPGPNRRS